MSCYFFGVFSFKFFPCRREIRHSVYLFVLHLSRVNHGIKRFVNEYQIKLTAQLLVKNWHYCYAVKCEFGAATELYMHVKSPLRTAHHNLINQQCCKYVLGLCKKSCHGGLSVLLCCGTESVGNNEGACIL